jgi:hypothetical protein
MQAMVPTWREYLLLHTRLTKMESELLDQVFSLSAGPKPQIHHYALIKPQEVEGLKGL